jgi:PIN domain nuclease of toxin-antitoxin system
MEQTMNKFYFSPMSFWNTNLKEEKKEIVTKHKPKNIDDKLNEDKFYKLLTG